MQIDYKIPTHGVNLLNFDVILRDTIKCSKDKCIEYNLIFDPVDNIESKRIFINFLVITLCERIKSLSSNRHIIYINNQTTLLPTSNNLYFDIINIVLDLLSLKYITYNKTFESFCNDLSNRDSDSLYVFDKAFQKTTTKINKVNYKKLTTFFKSNGLLFLYNTYFQNTNNKMVLFR